MLNNAQVRTSLFILFCLLSFAVYHSNTGRGPDSSIYMRVAHRVVTEGHLNTLPTRPPADFRTQITTSKHAPIHQNVGGVLFFLPATVAARLSLKVASFFPHLPPRLYDINYHEMLWVGSTAYVLALLSCLLMFQVSRRYASLPAVMAALLACFYGGPLLIYSSVFPCQMTLPAGFLAALLLYCYHFAELEKKVAWMLLGAIWGLGVFVRSEFVIWAPFVLFAIIASSFASTKRWRQVLIRGAMAGAGAFLFLIPSAMIRHVVFGAPGSTYWIQFDLEILAHSYLMLFGGRNGLFVFWPVLGVALLGYCLKWRQNPALFHIMALILLGAVIICGATIFWSGELGVSFGQRRFLVVIPCFVLFLARLFDLGQRFFWWLATLCAFAALWSLSGYCVYGEMWSFADGRVGFLMPYHLSMIVSAVGACFPELPRKIVSLVLLPKHPDIWWLLPLATMGGMLLFLAGRALRRRGAEWSLAGLVALACGMIVFLSGAGQRGEAAFAAIAQANPQARFIVRNYEIDDEIMGSMVDVVSFFLEIGQEQTAGYFVEKAQRFFAVEAPDQLDSFAHMVDALVLRQAMGWYRLVPEQSHNDLLEWYLLTRINGDNGLEPPDISGQFLY